MAFIKNYYYLMIDSAQNFDLDQIKVKNKFTIIMTLLKDYKDNQIKHFRNQCKAKKIKFFIKNNIKLVVKHKADGLYISSHNKNLKLNQIKNLNIDIIGSAHNLKELNIKIQQKCSRIIFSRLFKTNYKDKKTFLGIMKFNLFSRITSKELIPLGGIRENNLQLTRLTNSKGICILSEAKKKPAKIISRLF